MKKSQIYYKDIIELLELKYSRINMKMKKIKIYNLREKYHYKKLKSKYKKLLYEKNEEYMDIFVTELLENETITLEEKKHIREVFDNIYIKLGIYEEVSKIKNK